MPRLALTDRFVAGAKPDKGGRASYFDATIAGTELLVSAKTKTFYAHCTTPGGKRIRVKIGNYPIVGLAFARARTLEIRREAEAGKDPRDITAQVPAMTIGSLTESYLAKHVRPNLRSAALMESRLFANVTPIIGQVRLADLHRRDINRVVDAIVARGSLTQARLVYTDLRGMLNWAVKRGDLDRTPMSGMDAPSQSVPRERVLSDDEIRSVWASPTKSQELQMILRLCLATGQRVGEVCGMRRDEIDMKARIWNLPGSRTKNGVPHALPLNDLAMSIIRSTLAATEGQFMFPGGEASLHPGAVAKLLWRHQCGLPRWSAHDLRRSVLTNLAKLGVAPIVIAHVANHQSVARAGVTFAHYVRHGYEREMREALDLWADRLEAIVSGKVAADVVPMKRMRP